MLSNSLVTNEVKDAAAAEVEFSRLSQLDRSTEFAKVGEAPNAPYRLKISHQETGVGDNARRRSVVRFDKGLVCANLPTKTVSAYCVLDVPIGVMQDTTEAKNVLANLMSFLATTGAATTVLFDCTGNGASTLISGGL